MIADTFFGIINYWTYLIGVIAVILLPGPNSMYCLHVGSSQGIKRGYQTVLAIVLGDCILMVAAVLGTATMLKTNPSVFTAFKLLGGLYLAYIGVSLLRGAYGSVVNLTAKAKSVIVADGIAENAPLQAEVVKEQTTTATKSTENVFLKAFTLSMSNPKAILFFMSFFVQFVDPTYDNTNLSFFILGLTLQIISFTYLSMLLLIGTRLVTALGTRPWLGIIGNATVGVLFIGFAISLWLAKL